MPRGRARLFAPLRRSTATGSSPRARGCLALAAMLALREAGIWFSDRLVWPTLLAAVGAVLVWRQTAMRTPPLEETARPERELREAPEPASRASLYRGGFGVALIGGAALLVLQAAGALSGLRDAVLTIVVVVIALRADPRAVRLAPGPQPHRRALGPHPLAGARRGRGAPARLGPADAGARAEAGRRPAGGRDAGAAAGARAARVAVGRVRRRGRFEPARRPGGGRRAGGGGSRRAIDVVAVGDRVLDERAEALVAAAREAMVNAAKFAGDAGPVSRLRRGGRRAARGVRPRPRPRLRPRRRPGRPPRRARVDHRPHGAPRRPRRRRAARPGGGTEVELSDRRAGDPRTAGPQRRHRRRPLAVPRRRARRARGTRRGRSARPRRSRTPCA